MKKDNSIKILETRNTLESETNNISDNEESSLPKN